MNIIQSTLIHRILAPRANGPGKPTALILLHGRGSDENDLFGLSEYLDDRLFIISVRAPYQFSYGGGYTWFDVEDIGKPEIKMLNESLGKLIQFIRDVHAGYPVDKAKTLLFGFSMGSMMSYIVSLTNPELTRGVIAASGLLPEGIDLGYNFEGQEGKPFFISHGIHDSIIPVSFGTRAKELLSKAGAIVTYREYEMDHQINEENLADIIKWIGEKI